MSNKSSSVLPRVFRPALVLTALLATSGTASAASYGVSLPVEESAGDFGISLIAKAGVAADNEDTLCQSFWDMYDNCVQIHTQFLGAAMAQQMCAPQADFAELQCSLIPEHNAFIARAYLDFETKLFGKDIELVYLYGGGGVNMSSVWGRVEAKLLGTTVESWSQNVNLDSSVTMSQSLVDIPVFGGKASANFNLAGIKVKVKAEAGGIMGVGISGTVNSSSVSPTVTPSATVGASASATVDVVVAAFGVTGEATLLDISTPATATITHLSGATFNTDYSLSYAWEALSGTMEVFVKVAGVIFDDKIINHNGWSDDDVLFSNDFDFTL